MSAIVEIRGLTKRYGNLTAVDELTLDIAEGSVFGFIGPNGAGKSTTMRILTTLLLPTSGEARVAGHDVRGESAAVRRVIGYMPDFFGVYDDMMVWEYLDFFAACYDIPAALRPGLVADLLELVNLSDRRESQVEDLSRGMKQRLCLARTLAHDPQVLILDEPASGLDPRARIEMRDLLRELQNMGKTIFFSSHILSEVSDVCTHIGIIGEGRLVASGDISTMRRQLRAHRGLIIDTLSPDASWLDLLRRHEGVREISPKGSAERPWMSAAVDFSGDDAALSQLLAALVNEGVPVISFSEESGDLEDIFLQVTDGLFSKT